ncbi:hypothetical protein [Devosia ginsengisoli]|uniref:hypothetical protein n=1 Tax=Devosia ginsengisoli TaxID=400770 RepID=UPI0026ECEE23|nr:hypothetical protein [Devosia ginsengisoli]MCR6673980.1 hypothetical protein [Devosia ginsengisoli]
MPAAAPHIGPRPGPLNTAAIAHLVMVILSIFCLFPVYWMLVSSFRPANTLSSKPASGRPSPSLDNYTRAIDAIPIARMLVNTLVFSAVSTVFQLADRHSGRFRLCPLEVPARQTGLYAAWRSPGWSRSRW